ncbi:hypothetical protein LWI29_023936 [Acer saccharum]|uniref:Uncharacterized protein n=1 Tax=Acer saccharum TaxID=4024 RepID=A0AA39VWL1_ACESA|nr:hypothetical protein LWI29_023936 [Acer saccharum]
MVSLEEDAIPVDLRWTESFLALTKVQEAAEMEVITGMESIQKAQPKEVGGFSSSCHTLAGNDKAFLGQCCQDGKAAKKVKIGLTGQRKLLVGNRYRGSSDKGARMLRVKGISDKGKKKWVGKSKKKHMAVGFQNGNLNLEKRQGIVRGSINFSEDSATSSEEGTRESLFLDSLKVRGECSKRKGDGGGSGLDSLEGRSLPGGPPKPKRVSTINTPSSPVVYKNMYGGVELCVDLGLVEEEGEAFSSSVDSVVRATVLVEEERAREDELFQYSEVIEVEATKNKVRVHNQEVNCRENYVEQCDRGSDDNSSSTAKEVMVLATVAVEEERAIEVEHADAVVKKRYTDSLVKKKGILSSGSSNSHRMRTRNSSAAEEEATKVMEVGNALGFDFRGIEKEMVDVIVRREAEDSARFEERNG